LLALGKGLAAVVGKALAGASTSLDDAALLASPGIKKFCIWD
jgi:hypothetical protein